MDWHKSAYRHSDTLSQHVLWPAVASHLAGRRRPPPGNARAGAARFPPGLRSGHLGGVVVAMDGGD
eukprot:14539030-Heterocapsa_arctica.AAC.1